MKNQQTVLIGVALVILGALLGYRYLNSRTVPPAEPGASESVSDSEQGMRSLMDLVADGKNVKCNYSTTDSEGNVVNGEVYVAEGKSRSNYQMMMADGKTFEGGVITDDTYSYVWGSGMDGGIKMKLNEQASDESAASNSGEYVKPDQEMDYRCDPWQADESLFTPPSEIEFRDLGAMMEDTKAQQCGVCANLEGELKTTCEQQVGC